MSAVGVGRVLRVYDPAECDERGVPLDWDRCRTCGGSGRFRDPRYWGTMPGSTACEHCEGRGSLKAAALYGYLRHFDGYDKPELPIRCEGEDCGHPMSDGTWSGSPPPEIVPATPDYFWGNVARDGFTFTPYVHYSPCDEGCTHGYVSEENTGLRWVYADPPIGVAHEPILAAAFEDDTLGLRATIRAKGAIEASWRPVEVRTLGWAHDLRPEKLAVLCLRCWGERQA